jgi:hypothetical protein
MPAPAPAAEDPGVPLGADRSAESEGPLSLGTDPAEAQAMATRQKSDLTTW